MWERQNCEEKSQKSQNIYPELWDPEIKSHIYIFIYCFSPVCYSMKGTSPSKHSLKRKTTASVIFLNNYDDCLWRMWTLILLEKRIIILLTYSGNLDHSWIDVARLTHQISQQPFIFHITFSLKSNREIDSSAFINIICLTEC